MYTIILTNLSVFSYTRRERYDLNVLLLQLLHIRCVRSPLFFFCVDWLSPISTEPHTTHSFSTCLFVSRVCVFTAMCQSAFARLTAHFYFLCSCLLLHSFVTYSSSFDYVSYYYYTTNTRIECSLRYLFSVLFLFFLLLFWPQSLYFKP